MSSKNSNNNNYIDLLNLEKYPFIIENIPENNCIILNTSINNNNGNNDNNNIIENSLVVSKNNLDSAFVRKPVIHDFPDISLPFPPAVKAEDFIDSEVNRTSITAANIHKNSKKKKNSNKFTTKAPNKFFVYRKAWVLALREKGYQYPMTEISGFIAKKWQEESQEHRDAYIKIASDIKVLHREKFGNKQKCDDETISSPKKTIKKPKIISKISRKKSQIYIISSSDNDDNNNKKKNVKCNHDHNDNNNDNNNNMLLSPSSPLNIVPSSTSTSTSSSPLLYNSQSSSSPPLLFLTPPSSHMSNISYYSQETTPIDQFNHHQFDQSLLHNELSSFNINQFNQSLLQTSSSIFPTPGTTPSLSTPASSPPILPSSPSSSSSYNDDSYFNEFINIDNIATEESTITINAIAAIANNNNNNNNNNNDKNGLLSINKNDFFRHGSSNDNKDELFFNYGPPLSPSTIHSSGEEDEGEFESVPPTLSVSTTPTTTTDPFIFML